MTSRLAIFGASARAAAQSALRAGLQLCAADLFGDQDLAAICPTFVIKEYPQGFLKAAKELQPCPWMYTGGLENFPMVIDAISRERQLLGNPGTVTRQVRDPFILMTKLRAHGLLVPDAAKCEAPIPKGEWLIKPLRSAGGFSIRRLETIVRNRSSIKPRGRYLQQFVSGMSAGAVFIGVCGKSTLLGVTKQLHGSDGSSEKQFIYRGSIGPIPLSRIQHEQFTGIGDCLANDFQLAGLFGVDVIIDDDKIWTIEVNPRYSASAEILERAFDVNVIAMHLACFSDASPSILTDHQHLARTQTRIWGKEIVYAGRSLQITAEFIQHLEQSNQNRVWPQVADIPMIGSTIEMGHPVCTVFADGRTVEEVESKLSAAAREIRSSWL